MAIKISGSTIIDDSRQLLNVGVSTFSGNIVPENDSSTDIGTNSVRFANIYADTLYGDGSNLTNLPPSAPVGGASTNQVFFENDNSVDVNYSVTSGKNAMSAGPIAIKSGITVTVPSGSFWTIV